MTEPGRKHYLTSFRWHVHSDYRWAQIPDSSEWALVPYAEEGDEHASRCYRVQDHPALFRTFADCSPEGSGIRAFAARFGSLGRPFEVLFKNQYTSPQQPSPPAAPLRGVPERAWQREILNMRRATELWDLTRGEDELVLAKHILWQQSDSSHIVVYRSEPLTLPTVVSPELNPPVWDPIATPDKRPGLLRALEPGELRRPALVYLTALIDQRLRDHFTLRCSFKVRVQRRPSVRWVPDSLVTAMWLQLARAVQNDTTFRRCPVCSEWLAIAPGAHRTNREFCSTACRSRHYRQRQEQARQMFTDGCKIEDIASKLDADLAAVRRWITGTKGT